MIKKTTPPTAAALHISEAQPLISAAARQMAARHTPQPCQCRRCLTVLTSPS